MNYDIHQHIPQRSNTAQDAQNRRITEIANQLQRLCEIYGAQHRNSQKDVTPLDIEFIQTEAFAKRENLWFEMDYLFTLGLPGPSGNENDTYIGERYVYKVNNLLNSRSIINLLRRIVLHNQLFPETAYSLYGFTGFSGRSIWPILQQPRIANARPATQVMIDTYMAAIGFEKLEQAGRYINSDYEVWDLLPRNVLADKDGDIYVIDAEIKQLKQ